MDVWAVAETLFGDKHLLKDLLEADCFGDHGSCGSGQVRIDFEEVSKNQE